MIAIFVFIILLFSNCYTSNVGEIYRPTPGLLYSNVRFDGDFNPQNDVKPDNYAKGCVYQIFRIYSWGDAGAGSIAHRSHINRISHIDHSYTDFLFFVYGQYCTHVYGE